MTPKQERFVAEYVKDLNGTQAATRAGYSARTANEQGARLLANASVSQAIQTRQKAKLEALDFDAQRVIQELGRIAFTDMGGFFDDQGNIKAVKDMTPTQRAQLQSLEVIKKNAAAGDGITDTVYKFKLWDKTKALDTLAKHFGLLVEKVDVTQRSVMVVYHSAMAAPEFLEAKRSETEKTHQKMGIGHRPDTHEP